MLASGMDGGVRGTLAKVTWEQLAAATLARQFPTGLAADIGSGSVPATPVLMTPVLTPARRRRPWLPRCTGSDRSSRRRHGLPTSRSRPGQRALWARSLRLERATLEQVWAATEAYARDEWRTPAELHTHLRSWLDEHDPGHGARLDNTAGRYLGFGHGGLLRRPLRGGWEGQGAPGYRAARAVLEDAAARDAALVDPDTALVALVRRHLACHGPASRRDLAWWSGVGLRGVDSALARILELVTWEAPDGQEVHDLPGMPSGARQHPAEVVPGVRLLPEFDALLCAYDPPARARFVDPEHYQVLWTQENGLLRSPLMVDGRLTGHWRAGGQGRRRACVVAWFPGTRPPRKGEVEEQMALVAAAYPITWTGLEIIKG